MSIFDPAIFDDAIFDVGDVTPPLSGLIPRGATAIITVAGRPSAALAVPELSTGSVEVPPRNSATLEV